MQNRSKRTGNCFPEPVKEVVAHPGSAKDANPGAVFIDTNASDERVAIFESALLRSIERGRRHLAERQSEGNAAARFPERE